MRYTDKSFTVPTWQAPKDCAHGWRDKRGRCVMCGEKLTATLLRQWDEPGHPWSRAQTAQDAPQRDDGGQRDGRPL